MSKVVLPVLILLLFFTTSFSQIMSDKAYPVDPAFGFSTGPEVGEKVPEFTLPDQSGTMRSLRELLGKNGAILNFFRSADW
ncbi:MAG: hypothetical protein ACE5G1_09980 [bacterium]